MFTLENVDRLISIVLSKLVSNQNLLKCLYYPHSDALQMNDLTQSQIDSIFDNSEISENRISFTPFHLSTTDKEKSEIRIFARQFTPDNIHLSNVSPTIQVISHNNLWKMDQARIRPLVIIHEILKELNGEDIGFVGKLYFNSPIKVYSYNQYFSGYELHSETKLG